MATITDFEAWLDQADPDGYEEVFALYQAVTECGSFGFYECKAGPKGTNWFIKGGGTEDTLMLASQKARDAFTKLVEEKYGDGELDMESWYHYHRNMARDD